MPAERSSAATTRVLLVHPRFESGSFWNYRATCEAAGAKYPAPPLGLITVAAMLPAEWSLRLVDLNTVEDDAALDAGLAWADLVMSGGMLPQQARLRALIERARAAGKPVAVGGPDVTSSPDFYADASFRLLGEAEGCIDAFVEAWRGGARSGVFRAPLHSVDVTKTPTPRFDLLSFADYVQVNVQFSRGCPFLCEFCDIIELFGRKPRTKTSEQMIAELDALYALGYRGHVDFVDDNLIGNKKAVKAFLPDLIAWQRARGYPFAFSTEASINLVDDPAFLGLMRDAGFFAVFVGIESPDPDVLRMAQKKQNANRDIVEAIKTINSYGVFVVGGFILGFDNENPGAGGAIAALIRDAAIPVSMLGLLYALPGTQLTRRLAAEGRLHDAHDVVQLEAGQSADQCTQGLNFETLRPRLEIFEEFRDAVAEIYRADAYFGRVDAVVDRLDLSGANGKLWRARLAREATEFLRLVWRLGVRDRAMRPWFWRTVLRTLYRNPAALAAALKQTALYAHLGPFAEEVVAELDRMIAAERREAGAQKREAERIAREMAPVLTPKLKADAAVAARG